MPLTVRANARFPLACGVAHSLQLERCTGRVQWPHALLDSVFDFNVGLFNGRLIPRELP